MHDEHHCKKLFAFYGYCVVDAKKRKLDHDKNTLLFFHAKKIF